MGLGRRMGWCWLACVLIFGVKKTRPGIDKNLSWSVGGIWGARRWRRPRPLVVQLVQCGDGGDESWGSRGSIRGEAWLCAPTRTLICKCATRQVGDSKWRDNCRGGQREVITEQQG